MAMTKSGTTQAQVKNESGVVYRKTSTVIGDHETGVTIEKSFDGKKFEVVHKEVKPNEADRLIVLDKRKDSEQAIIKANRVKRARKGKK